VPVERVWAFDADRPMRSWGPPKAHLVLKTERGFGRMARCGKGDGAEWSDEPGGVAIRPKCGRCLQATEAEVPRTRPPQPLRPKPRP